MRIHDLSPGEKSKKPRWRVGRGPSSGNGKTSGRGHKGQNSRSGGGVRVGFEGGQMPLYRRLPKRGFTNIFSKEIAAINVGKLNEFFDDGAVIDAETLIQRGLIRKLGDGLKILGKGEITKKLTIKANVFSASAAEKIQAAGGKAEVV